MTDEATEVEIGTDEQETEVVLEEAVAEDTGSEVAVEDSGEDQFKKAESATQKRIDRLTKKMREAERREQEALRYAQAIQSESETLKQQVANLDTNYVNEYSSRVSSEIKRVEDDLTRAIDLGDSAAAVEAQRKLTALAIQEDRANQAKYQQEQQAQYRQQQAVLEQQQRQQQTQVQQQTPKRPDKKAEQWALKNEWFGQDEAMTYAAFGIHKTLVESEGFDPQSDDYYNELDKRIASKFKLDAGNSNKRPAQTVVGASRSKTSGRSKKVRLTPSQVAIAKKLGVPLEEYAKYVKD